MVLDKDTFEGLYYSCSQRLASFAGRILQDSTLAEDLVQDIFIRFWESYKDRDIESWEGVLFTMTRNRCLDYLKHLSVKHRIFGQELPASELEKLIAEDFSGGQRATDDDLVRAELDREVDRIIETMPPKCREVFTLSRKEGLSNKDIARQLGISLKSVEKHITKALKILKKLMQ